MKTKKIIAILIVISIMLGACIFGQIQTIANITEKEQAYNDIVSLAKESVIELLSSEQDLLKNPWVGDNYNFNLINNNCDTSNDFTISNEFFIVRLRLDCEILDGDSINPGKYVNNGGTGNIDSEASQNDSENIENIYYSAIIVVCEKLGKSTLMITIFADIFDKAIDVDEPLETILINEESYVFDVKIALPFDIKHGRNIQIGFNEEYYSLNEIKKFMEESYEGFNEMYELFLGGFNSHEKPPEILTTGMTLTYKNKIDYVGRDFVISKTTDFSELGNVNGMNLLLLKKHILGMDGSVWSNDSYEYYRNDLSGTGKINGMDLLLMKKIILSY